MAITPAADLFKHITSFDIDDGKPALTFTHRLARENGWKLDYAQRVVEEYKRFVYLACVASHPVTPSEQIDQAWHLHLTYTRSYWDRFCGQVLKRPLHHDPTRGGSEEGFKYEDQYERTIVSYIAAFHAPPPEDIWPHAMVRFGEDSDAVRVVKSKHVILRKPSAVVGIVALIIVLAITWFTAKLQGAPVGGVAKSSVGSFLLGFGGVIGVSLILLLIIRKAKGGGGDGSGGGGCGGGGGGWFGCGGDDGGGDSGGGCGSGCGGGGCGGS